MGVKVIPYHCQTLDSYQADHHSAIELCLTSASLNQLKQAIDSFLHPEEQKYFTTLEFPKRQQSYLLGRYAAKQALVRCCAESKPNLIFIKRGVFEQPIAYYPSSQKIQISLTHSGPLGAALAFPEEYPMGIDVELIQADRIPTIETQLTFAEKEWIQLCSHTPSNLLHTLFWTVKEALSKALRTGLTSPFEFYAIQETISHRTYWISKFQHFSQYQALSFLLSNYICSMVYPKQTRLMIDTPAIQQWMANLPFDHTDQLSVNKSNYAAISLTERG